MLTIDASVWVNGFDMREQGHETSYELLQYTHKMHISVFIPNLALVEIAGTVSRTRQNAELAIKFSQQLSNLPNIHIIPLDSQMAHVSMNIASRYALRGADSVYAAVALNHHCVLVSLDKEHLTRLDSLLKVMTPEEYLKQHN